MRSKKSATSASAYYARKPYKKFCSRLYLSAS
jgi:hypothetical protein